MKLKENKYNSNSNNSADNSSSWLVSFADLLSLILAFFVLVYSMSDIPQNKWNQYTESIMEYMVGNKINIFKQDIEITEAKKAKKINKPAGTDLGYIRTILDSVILDNKELADLFKYTQIENKIILDIRKDLISTPVIEPELTDRGITLFLNLSKIFQKIDNQILIKYPLKNNLLSAKVSDFIARKVKEFGYEYKVLRGLSFNSQDFQTDDINENFQIVIKGSETVL